MGDVFPTRGTSDHPILLAQNPPPSPLTAAEKTKKQVIVSYNQRLALLKKVPPSKEYQQMMRDHVGTIRLQIDTIEMFLSKLKDASQAEHMLRELLKPYLKPSAGAGDAQLGRWLTSAFQKDPSLRVRTFLVLAELATRTQNRRELKLAYEQIQSAPDNSGIPYHLQAKRWLFEAQYRLQTMSPVLSTAQQEKEIEAIRGLLKKAAPNIQWATHLRTEYAQVEADVNYRQGLILKSKGQNPEAVRAFVAAGRGYDLALKYSRETMATEYDRGNRRHVLNLGKLQVLGSLQRRAAFDQAFSRDVPKMPSVLKSQAYFEKARLYFDLGADEGNVNTAWVETARQSAISAAVGLAQAGPDYQNVAMDARFIEGESNLILGNRTAARTAFSIVANHTDKSQRPDMWARAQLNISQIDLIEKRFDSARTRIDQTISFLKSNPSGKKVDSHWFNVALLRRAESSLWQDVSKMTWKQRQDHFAHIQKQLKAIDMAQFDPHTFQAEYIHQLAIVYEGWSWSFYEMPRLEAAKRYMATARDLYEDAIREAEKSRFGYDRKIRLNELKLKLEDIDKYIGKIKTMIPAPQPSSSPAVRRP